MSVIFKRQSIEDALRLAQTRAASHSSKRNLTSRQCSICFMSFETYRMVPKQTCGLCRWEKAKSEGLPFDQYLKHNDGLMTEEDFYSKQIAKGIDLQRRKERTMKAAGVTFHRVLSERIKEFTDLLDT